jgi:hypothetical protein
VLGVGVPAFGGLPVLLEPSPDIGFTIDFAVHPSAPVIKRNVACSHGEVTLPTALCRSRAHSIALVRG